MLWNEKFPSKLNGKENLLRFDNLIVVFLVDNGDMLKMFGLIFSGYWYRMMSEEYFERLIRIYKIVVSDQLHRMNNLVSFSLIRMQFDYFFKYNRIFFS